MNKKAALITGAFAKPFLFMRRRLPGRAFDAMLRRTMK